MVRTRAAAAAAPSTQPLAAAPRRRIKVTPLEEEKPKAVQLEQKAKVTRSTRSQKQAVEVAAVPAKPVVKGRGRPKKEPAQEAKPTKDLADKPKRATNSTTRATATTRSSEAREKPSIRTTRKTTIDERVEEPQALEVEQEPEPRAGLRKKVTFLNVVDEKENIPVISKNAKKSTASKAKQPVETSVGLRAKPIRKPAATTTKTRATKRSKPEDSDTEVEEPQRKKIQRVLTPKKITQVARAITPHEDSEDELAGAKTPLRDLSISPRKPHASVTVANTVAQPSPARVIGFSQSFLHQSAKKAPRMGEYPMLSPARRPSSPLKISGHLSPAKILTSGDNTLASPARRPVSAVKALFPQALETNNRAHLSPVSTNLLQSPKRSTILDRSHVFAQSAIKTSNKSYVAKSAFFSSPAKRAGLSSPTKTQLLNKTTISEADLEHDLELNAMEVTQLLRDGEIEVNVSSRQRASVSPMRTYKLTEQDFDMDFDDSVLPIRSPLKLALSPAKSQHSRPDTIEDDDIVESLTYLKSTPAAHMSSDETGASGNMQDLSTHTLDVLSAQNSTALVERSTPSKLVSQSLNDESLDELALTPQEDVVAQFLCTPATVSEIGTTRRPQDFTAYYPNEIEQTSESPSRRISQARLDVEISSLSPSPAVVATTASTDKPIMATFSAPHLNSRASRQGSETVRMAGPEKAIADPSTSPCSLYQHELTTMGIGLTPKKFFDEQEHIDAPVDSPSPTHASSTAENFAKKHVDDFVGIDEHELTKIGNDDSFSSPLSDIHVVQSELNMPSSDDAALASSPAILREHELTMIGIESPDRLRTLGDETVEQRVSSDDDIQLSQSSPGTEREQSMISIASTANDADAGDATPTRVTSMSALRTPDAIPTRKFNLHTVVSKVPLKAEAQDSPLKLQIKKRKRPHSLGDQPELHEQDLTRTSKSQRRTESLFAASSPRPIVTPARTPAREIPLSKVATIKSARRAASTPVSRTPLAPSAGSDVLADVVAYVDVRTSEGADASAIYVDLLTSLGAKVVKDYSEEITHVVFKDGNIRVLEKVRLSENEVKVVGVAWPLDCEAQKSFVNEAEYLLDSNPTDRVLNSVTKSARRRSMEPSMLVSDGSGSVKRSKSRVRMSTSLGTIRRDRQKVVSFTPTASIFTQLNTAAPAGDTRESQDSAEVTQAVRTPQDSPATTAAKAEKLSLTAAWKSINASQNLGDDTPARKTLELLQKSYSIHDDSAIDNSFTSEATEEYEDNEDTPVATRKITDRNEDQDVSLIETGLTPAPYKTKMHIGSAPSKINNVGMMSYRERVEEMERREMRTNAFGTKNGARGVGAGKKGGMRMSVFGFDSGN